jgi:hypothetical protein
MIRAAQVLPAATEGRLAEVASDHQPAARVLAVDDEPAACKLLSLESARETIRRWSGIQFDSRVADVFLSIPEKTWLAIARNQRQVAALSPQYRGNGGLLRMGLRYSLD